MKQDPNDQPGFWRLTYGARLAGLTPQALEAGCASGAIPVECIRLSERVAIVRAADMSAWLKGNEND